MDKIKHLGEPIPVKEIVNNLSSAELRKLAKQDEVQTEFGSPSYISKIKSRSAKFTEIIYDQPNEAQAKIIRDVQGYLKDKKLLAVDRQMCQPSKGAVPKDRSASGVRSASGGSEDMKLHCRTYVTPDFARIAYMWHETLFPWNALPDHLPAHSHNLDEGIADVTVIDVPEWPERKVLVLPKLHLTYVLGTDYFGEIKKANLRMGMYLAKLRGWLGLHAASKLIRVKDTTGKLVEKGVIIFGLSGTGKTSLSCHHHGLAGEEGITIRQDDVVFMRKDAYCYGTEDNFYLKTEGLTLKDQPLLYRGATSPNAILENIYVSPEGRVDFSDSSLTSNGRGIVRRKEMTPYTDNDINLPRADVIIFLTRRMDIVPPVAKLTPDQGAAFFMLGESVETSAGDPTKAGQALRVVGTNPFIIGPAEEEGNWFYELLQANPKVECFMMNTGRVGGNDGEKITVIDSSEIIKQIVRGGITWRQDEDWGYQIPSRVEGINYERFDPMHFYSAEEYRNLVRKLHAERTEWLARFPKLAPQVAHALRD